jgi:hypothetical protein
MEGSDHDPIKVLSQPLPERLRKTTKSLSQGRQFLKKDLNWDFLNAKQKS